MEEPQSITVQTIVYAPIDRVWQCWTETKHITQWAFASDDWEAPSAENDVRTGGRFKTVMAAKDKSISFEFTGVYTNINTNNQMEYDMDDGRHVSVEFEEIPDDGVQITQIFQPETENPLEAQRKGWQSILNNFKKYVESV